jgi:hypothetical protein
MASEIHQAVYRNAFPDHCRRKQTRHSGAVAQEPFLTSVKPRSPQILRHRWITVGESVLSLTFAQILAIELSH